MLKHRRMVVVALLHTCDNTRQANFLDKTDHQENTALHMAAEYGHTSLVDLLCRSGASPNVVNDADLSPLMLAARHGTPGTVQAMVRHGADVDQSGGGLMFGFPGGMTSLMIAAHHGNGAAIRVLLRAGALVAHCLLSLLASPAASAVLLDPLSAYCVPL